MTSIAGDTIVARATPVGRGGVGIVRVSGPCCTEVAHAVLGHIPEPRYATYTPFLAQDGRMLDEGIALFFKAPHSFTGEDVLELQCHGGAIVIEQLIMRVLAVSSHIRLAHPGEFSERAFLNDKIDLVQAEAIADLIDATSVEAAASAVRSLQGEFSKKIAELVNALILLRMTVESAIDFPEEEIDFLGDAVILESLTSIHQQLECILKEAKEGVLLRDGVSVVIAGPPNAGKSSLLNALSRRESAIVTDIPGTTRDVLKEYIHIDGIPLHIMDTAGLRESSDVVEKIGMERARREVCEADIVLWVVDVSCPWPFLCDVITTHATVITVCNKIDIIGGEPHVEGTKVFVSIKQQRGLNLLVDQLKKTIGIASTGNACMARQRHIEALKQAKSFVEKGMVQLCEYKAGELLAQDLMCAQNALSTITGQFTSDDLLGVIFSTFCIGK